MAKSRLKEKHRAKMALKLRRIREEQAREMDEHQKELGDIKPILPKPKIVEAEPDVKPTDDDLMVRIHYTIELDLRSFLKFILQEITEEDADTIKKQIFKSLPFTMAELKEMDDDVQEQKWSSLSEAQLEVFTNRIYDEGRYSPVLGADNQAMPGIEVIDEADDLKQLRATRKRNREGNADPLTVSYTYYFSLFTICTFLVS